MVLPDHLKSMGLREHLQSSVEDLVGSPMLFQLFTFAKEWIESHPFSITATPTPLPSNHPSASTSKAPAQNVCKFFAKGTCKYGDKCKNYHPDPKQKRRDTQTSAGSESKKKPAPTGDSMKPEPSRNHAPGREDEEEEEEGESNQRSKESGGKKKQSMRTASDVISRVLWDPDIPTGEFTVGYLDRFVGVIEKPFTAFSWEDLCTVGPSVLAVPRHRIQYFKYRQQIVWDKAAQLDNVFGSRGGKLIQDVIQEAAGGPSQQDGQPSGGASNSADDDKAAATAGGKSRAHGQEERPTHFLCIRVTDEGVVANAERVQSDVVSHSPHLAEGCLPPTALHVTVCMVKLDTPSHLETARDILERTKHQLVQYLPGCAEIEFTGVDNFRERLVYAKVAPNPALDRFSAFLIERFQSAGLRTPGNHAQFTPHMTLVKMSRPMQHATHTSIISRDAYCQFADTPLGRQRVAGIYLCSMTEARQEDGFYKRFHFVSNSVLNLSPMVGPLLSKCVNFLRERDVVQSKEASSLLKAIASTPGSDADVAGRLDAAVESICRHVRQHLSNASNPPLVGTRVVILRGLPGSGKSHLARNCSEVRSGAATSSTAICSADDYFTQSDHYKFVQGRLPEAHSHCYQQFLQALSEGKAMVVVDNTHSMQWEYGGYIYLCELLGLQWHLLEIPHPDQRLVRAYCSRNQHKVDMASIASYTKRWQEDKHAMLVPPRLAYPPLQGEERGSGPTTGYDVPPFSLLSLCRPGFLPREVLGLSSTLVPVYTAVFLTPKSQWKLLSAVPPTHPRIHGDHVTLHFEPSLEQVRSAEIGKKVSVSVRALCDTGGLQAVAVILPSGLTSDNKCPHVTLSTDEASAPKLVNDLLESRATTPLSQPLKLSGMVGVVMREATSSRDFYTILSKKHFQEAVLPRISDSLPAPSSPPSEVRSIMPEHPPTSDMGVSICTGDQKVTELCVFDFDGTLFDTPDPAAGRQLYRELTGQNWPHRGWLGRPESLMPPLRVRPGPALAECRRHIGRAGSVVVVLTARITQTKSAVQTVLDDHQLHPDRLIVKPGETRQATPEFKVQALAGLLEQFPDVELVKFWDDREDNLQAVKSFSKRPGKRNVRFEIIDSTRMMGTEPATLSAAAEVRDSALGSQLVSRGLLPTRQHVSAAETGLRFIAAQFCAVVGYGGEPADLTLVFGSHPLGRLSDVDLCLLAPPGHTHSDCIEGLAGRLESCGISHLHKGYSSRCPRLKVMLQFRESPSIDYDIVFATLPSQEAFDTHMQRKAQVRGGGGGRGRVSLVDLLAVDDLASKTALTGVTLLGKVQEIISGANVSPQLFGAVVEMAVQVLKAARQKANFYHHIRSFHIVLLLADCICHSPDAVSAAAGLDCDALFELLVSHAAGLAPADWQRVFEEYIPVPHEYVPRQSHVFRTLLETVGCKDLSLTSRYEELLLTRPAFPPAGYTPVWLLSEADRHVDLWGLRTLLEAKLPTFIQQLGSSGLDVVLDGNGVHSSFCFAVRDTPSSKTTLQLIFRRFWNEFSEYRNRKDVRLELKFSRAGAELEELGVEVSKQVEEFASGQLTELHLPPTLSSYKRLLVHETAERLGVNHKTVGQDSKRHVYLHK